MNVVERAVAGFCRAVLWLSTSVIFVILCANTVLRYATGSSIQWANEVPELLFPWLVMSGVVLAALHGAHITTSFMMDKLPFALRRPISVLTWLAVAAMYSVLAIATFRMLEVVHDEKSPILQLPGSITYGCVMGGMALLALLAVFSAWRVWQMTVDPLADGEPHVPQAHW
jgi:TRAP-type C4-dicarboxylate transport system permease small subunit